MSSSSSGRVYTRAAKEALAALRGRKALSRAAATLVFAAGLGILAADGLNRHAAAAVDERFEDLRAQTVTISTSSGASVDLRDPATHDLVDSLSFVESAGVVWSPGSSSVHTRPDRRESDVPILAFSPGALDAANARVMAGREFDLGHVHRGDRVALVGSGLADRLGALLSPGAHVVIDDRSFAVLGVIDDIDVSTEALLGIVVPSTTAQAIWPASPDTAPELIVDVQPGAASLTAEAIPILLAPDRAETINSAVPLEPTSLMDDIAAQLGGLILFASAALLVAGLVTVLLQMFSSVQQRTTEIGLRIALGSSRNDIRLQFIAEGALTTFAGAAAASLVAAVGLVGIALAASRPLILSPWVLALPALLTGVGALAAALPADRAAKTDPAIALRAT